MGVDPEELPQVMMKLQSRIGVGRVEDNLVEVGLATIRVFQGLFPFMMMSWSNPKMPGCLPDVLDGSDPPPLRAQSLVASYLEAEIRLGRIRTIEPRTVARAFTGALSAHVFSEILIRRTGGRPIDSGEYIRDLVAALWGGMRPADQAVEPTVRGPVAAVA
jgi:hypothetical protein